MRWITALSARVSRTAADAAEIRGGKGKFLGIALLGAGLGLWSVLFIPHFTSELAAWNHIAATEPIDRASWTQVAPGAYETTIAPESLKRAEAAGTTVLYLGEFFAPYKILIDGVISGKTVHRGPAFVPFEAERLKNGPAIHARIEVKPDPEGGLPADFLVKGSAHTVSEGFLSPDDESRVRLMLNIYRRVRPAAFTLAYVVICAFFFLLWQATPLRLDYLGMALFALSCTFYQAGRTDFLSGALTHHTRIWLGVLTKGSFASTGLALGLGFARWRPGFFWGVELGGLALCALGGIIAPHLEQTRDIEYVIELWGVPVAFLLGGLACLAEAIVLRRGRRGEHVRPGFRVRSLFAFAATMIAMAGYQFALQRFFHASSPLVWLLMGTETFGLMVFLSILALRDYRTQQKLLARIPVSQYHQRDPLPRALSGALMMVDIKNSEALFRIGAAEGNAGMLVDRCLSHLWSSVVHAGGFVLRTDGDGLVALFNAEDCPEPMAAALGAADGMRDELAILAEQLAEEGYLGPGNARLDFRASVTLGQVKPIWLEIGGTRAAAWTETGNQNTFVEAARLLDLERTLKDGPWPEHEAPASAVLVQERDTPSSVSREWKKRGLRLTGKHGNHYEVAVYIPKPKAEPEHAARAPGDQAA